MSLSASTFAYPITSPADTALAGGSVIDFSAQTIGRYTSLAIGDVTFTANDMDLSINDDYSNSYNTTGQYLSNENYSNNGFSSLNIDFAGGVNAFGFNWGASDYTWTLSVFDDMDVLIESTILPDTHESNSGEFFGIAANGIAYAVLTNNNSTYDWIFIDNFTTSTSAVPVPAAVWLFGSGLLGLIGLFRNKRDMAA